MRTEASTIAQAGGGAKGGARCVGAAAAVLEPEAARRDGAQRAARVGTRQCALVDAEVTARACAVVAGAWVADGERVCRVRLTQQRARRDAKDTLDARRRDEARHPGRVLLPVVEEAAAHALARSVAAGEVVVRVVAARAIYHLVDTGIGRRGHPAPYRAVFVLQAAVVAHYLQLGATRQPAAHLGHRCRPRRCEWRHAIALARGTAAGVCRIRERAPQTIPLAWCTAHWLRLCLGQ
eukprot:scaffold8227_cov72-Phaeocystis_antarctica.AAC.10